MNNTPVSVMTSPRDSRRYRISDRLSGTGSSIFEGKLDKRFYPYFDYLLDSEHSPEEHSHFYDIYVENPDLESRLLKRISSPSAQITAITGARGIGKSTNIRYFFGVSTQPKIREMSEILRSEAPEDNSKCLIVPFYMDTHNISIKNVQRMLTSQVQAAAEFLTKAHKLPLSDDTIFDFVHTHKSQLVTFSELPLGSTPGQRMERFRNSNPYGYATEVLKYALHKTDIERIIMIVDDIESCNFGVQKELVKGVLKLRDCLKNVGRMKRNYSPDFIFTCRPATFQLLKSDSEIDGFSVGHPISIQKPAGLGKIVGKRFDYALKMIGEGKTIGNVGALSKVKNLESWKEAYQAFSIVVSRIASVHESLIVDLCNHDVRRALIDLQETLRNSRWYETRSHSAGAFTVDDRDYNFATAGIVRALVLRDQEYFSDELDSTVPNLFFNREETDCDLILLHVVKMFFEKARSRRVTTIKKSDIKKSLYLCYPKEIVNDFFDEILSYARNTEVLREEKVAVGKGKNRSEIYIVPMNKAFTLWKLCKNHSVFLEFFRDNTFLEHRRIAEFPLSRTRGTSRLPSDQKFILCADFISEVSRAEQKVLKYVSDTGATDKYFKTFGKRSISDHIYWGLRSSVRRAFPSVEGQSTIPRDVSAAIRKATNNVRLVRF